MSVRKRPQAKMAGTSKRNIDKIADAIGTKGRRATPTPKSQRKAPAKTAAKSGTGSFRKSGQAVMAAKGRTSLLGGRPSTKTAATYKVKSGDTLSEIAKKRGTTIKKLMAANPSIKNANQIRAGQTLKMPTAGKKASSPYTGLTAGQIKTGARTAKGGGMMMMKKTKGMSKGGKMPMAKDPKTGKMVPAFAIDGKGKMMAGGMMKKTKGMAKGGATKKTKGMAVGGMMKKTKGMAKGGAMKGTKGYAKGGMMKKTKGMARGGMMKGTKGYSRGGVARGMGAATKGGKFTRGG
jgi:LysM repeat protein